MIQQRLRSRVVSSTILVGQTEHWLCAGRPGRLRVLDSTECLIGTFLYTATIHVCWPGSEIYHNANLSTLGVFGDFSCCNWTALLEVWQAIMSPAINPYVSVTSIDLFAEGSPGSLSYLCTEKLGCRMGMHGTSVRQSDSRDGSSRLTLLIHSF